MRIEVDRIKTNHQDPEDENIEVRVIFHGEEDFPDFIAMVDVPIKKDSGMTLPHIIDAATAKAVLFLRYSSSHPDIGDSK